MGLNDLRWPWVLLGGAALVLGLLLWWARAPRAGATRGALLLAHAERLRTLPRYAVLLRRRQLVTAYHAVAALAVCAGALVLAARPQTTTVEQPDNRSRDIILCLDASGSMQPYNVQVMRELRPIVAGLEGERIGLTVFSGAAVTVFPLTDDYAFVLDQLDQAERAFRDGDYDFVAGIQLDDDRASQLGDGIASCAQGFDRPEEQRGRALIVTSDNDPQGAPIYTVGEGADYAADRGVVVHGICSPETPSRAARADFEEAATSTGGIFAVLGQDGTSAQILDRIDDLEQKRIEVPPRVLERDDVRAGSVLAGAGMLMLLGGWVAGGLAAVRTRRPAGGTP